MVKPTLAQGPNLTKTLGVEPLFTFMESNPKLLPLSEFNAMDSFEWRKENAISQCKIALYKYKGPKKPPKLLEETTYLFNKEGKIEKKVLEKAKAEYYYNDLNELKEMKLFLKSGKLFREKLFEYEDGLIKQIKVKINGALNTNAKGTIGFSYNEAKKPTEIMIYTKEDYEYYRERYKYGEDGNKIELQICKRGMSTATNIPKSFSKLNCGNKVEYQYDEGGNILKETYYHPSFVPVVGMVNQAEPQGYLYYTYNENGDITEIKDYKNTNELKSKTVFTYDNGKPTMKIEYALDNTITSMVSYKYDEKGIKNEVIIHDLYTRKPKEIIKLTYN